jgi:hypothetical protein
VSSTTAIGASGFFSSSSSFFSTLTGVGVGFKVSFLASVAAGFLSAGLASVGLSSVFFGVSAFLVSTGLAFS